MKFKDEQHEQLYLKLLSQCNRKDCETMPLCYLLALACETEARAKTCFNFKYTSIEPKGLEASWQYGTSTKAIKLAFNLWNGFGRHLEGFEGCDTSCFSVFGTSWDKYFMEALKLRFEIRVNIEYGALNR